MKNIILLLFTLLCFGTEAAALNVNGMSIEPSAKVGDELLQHNGSALRKKFFIKIYLGSLYTFKPVRSSKELFNLHGGKLIRMTFIYSRVTRLNIIGAFAEGIYRNSPTLSGSAEEKVFYSWFKNDFVEGDVVDLAIDRDGTVSAYHNFIKLGSIHSPKLAKGILQIYFGDVPADKKLKKGMLSS